MLNIVQMSNFMKNSCKHAPGNRSNQMTKRILLGA
jgi:hypothetical protein